RSPRQPIVTIIRPEPELPPSSHPSTPEPHDPPVRRRRGHAMTSVLPPIFTGRQNLDEWSRQVEAITLLNGMPPVDATNFARARLHPEIARAEAAAANHADRNTLQLLKDYLEQYMIQHDRFRLGALDQIRDKKYNK